MVTCKVESRQKMISLMRKSGISTNWWIQDCSALPTWNHFLSVLRKQLNAKNWSGAYFWANNHGSYGLHYTNDLQGVVVKKACFRIKDIAGLKTFARTPWVCSRWWVNKLLKDDLLFFSGTAFKRDVLAVNNWDVMLVCFDKTSLMPVQYSWKQANSTLWSICSVRKNKLFELSLLLKDF